jgi:phosphocarrier protein
MKGSRIDMIEVKYVIKDPVGIHARPAGLLVKEAKKYKSTITFIKGDKEAKATSLMKLMGMGIVQNDEVTIRFDGEDEEACSKALVEFMDATFKA